MPSASGAPGRCIVAISSRRIRKVVIPHHGEQHRTWQRIENLVGRMNDLTRIALRKDRTSRSPAGFASLASTLVDIQLRP